MSCILRFSGKHLDVEALLKCTSIKPDRIWSKGEPKFKRKPEGTKMDSSGVTFLASDADFTEFDKQIEDTTEFLKANKNEILSMATHASVEFATLDFGVALRDEMIHSDTLNPQFLLAVGSLNVEVKISHYPCEE
jgi:hypothetical protein